MPEAPANSVQGQVGLNTRTEGTPQINLWAKYFGIAAACSTGLAATKKTGFPPIRLRSGLSLCGHKVFVVEKKKIFIFF